MRFKTKYNIGDIVQFYNERIHNNDIGTIQSVNVYFSWETLQKESYDISPARIESDFSYNGIVVDVNSVYKKLNKKAFEEEFAKKCVKYIEKVGGESECE